jgi:O-antigen ligase
MRLIPGRAGAAVLAMGGALVVALSVLFGSRVWLPVVGAGLLAALVKWPEAGLLLFLSAGTFKSELAALFRTELDVTLVLAAVLALAIAVRVPLRGWEGVVPTKGLSLPFAALASVLLVSALLHPDSSYGWAKTFRFAGLTGLAVLAGYAVVADEARLTRFLLCAVGMGIFMVLAGRVTSAGLTAFGATHIATGRLLGLGLLGSLYLLLRKRNRLGRVVLVVALGALGYGFLYSGSRGSLVALAVSLVVVGAASFGFRRGRRWVAAAGAVLAVAAACITFLFPAAAETMNGRVAAVLEDAGSVGSAAGRVERAQDALELFRQQPVFGVGVGGFDLARGYGDGLRGDYPHNIVLEVACELGVLGLALFLALVVPALAGAVRAVGRTQNREGFAATAAVLAVLVYFLANAMFSGDLNDNRMLFAALGLSGSMGRNDERGTMSAER